MRKFVATGLFISLTVTPFVTLGQKHSTELAENERAAQVADRFVEPFRQSLDFGIAWKAFRLSDASCTHRANGILDESDYERLKPSSKIIEKLYIATMNFYYLQAAHAFISARIDSQSSSKEPRAPRNIESVEKKSKFFQSDDRKLQSNKEISELIDTFNQLAQLYREQLPMQAMKSATWRANQKYLIDRTGVDHSAILNGNATFCVPEQVKVYIVD